MVRRLRRRQRSRIVFVAGATVGLLAFGGVGYLLRRAAIAEAKDERLLKPGPDSGQTIKVNAPEERLLNRLEQRVPKQKPNDSSTASHCMDMLPARRQILAARHPIQWLKAASIAQDRQAYAGQQAQET